MLQAWRQNTCIKLQDSPQICLAKAALRLVFPTDGHVGPFHSISLHMARRTGRNQ